MLTVNSCDYRPAIPLQLHPQMPLYPHHPSTLTLHAKISRKPTGIKQCLIVRERHKETGFPSF
uniref:Uncharacterized protein n=1 Tax=Anguilla anguilla TaxID=7936 RepID=A0A0E9PV16_ANGAN